MSRWRWRPALHGYAYHVDDDQRGRHGSAWIQLETRLTAGDLPVLVPDAKEAAAFHVAILVAGQPTERFRLVGPLERLMRRLPAVLDRRIRRAAALPAPTALPKWNGPGCWCALHASEAADG